MDIDTLDKYKPENIFKIISKDFFKEDLGTPDHDEYLLCDNYYEYYYALSRYYQPETLLEIGVRRGYSMAFIIKGSDNIRRAEGWDIPNPINSNYVHDCLSGLDSKILNATGKDIEIDLKYCNSQNVNKLQNKYDLIHIDGAHERVEKLHDLELIIGACKVAIIDDYKCSIVGGACREFLNNHQGKFKKGYIVNTIRGTLVLEQ